MGQDSKDKKTLTPKELVDKLIQYGSFARSHLNDEERFEFQQEVVDVLYQARIYVEKQIGGISELDCLYRQVYWLNRVVEEQLLEYSGTKAKLEEVRITKLWVAKEAVMYWLGDGTDDPEKLFCPVVMHPECVRKLTRKIERLEAENSVLLKSHESRIPN